MEKHWNKTVAAALDRLLKKPRFEPCYAVFDWDNTSIFHDIGTAVFIHQLETLHFQLSPNQFEMIMRETLHLSLADLSQEQRRHLETRADKLSQQYQILYMMSETLGGDQSFSEVQKTSIYIDFCIQMIQFYQKIGTIFSTKVSYPWVTYFLAGMTSPEVQILSQQTIRKEQKRALTGQVWHSKDHQVGFVQIPTGIRIFHEMQCLYRELMAVEIDVYICSASQQDIVVPFAKEYQIPSDHVFGMRLMKKNNDVLMPRLDQSYPLTQSEGKVLTIREKIAPLYNGRGPILVGGDSSGDAAMLSAFSETEISLIIDRQTTGEIEQLKEQARETAGSVNQRYYLQKRDERRGCFIV